MGVNGKENLPEELVISFFIYFIFLVKLNNTNALILLFVNYCILLNTGTGRTATKPKFGKPGNRFQTFR